MDIKKGGIKKVQNEKFYCKHNCCNCLSLLLIIPMLLFSLIAIAALTISIVFSNTEFEGAQVQLQGVVPTIDTDAPVIFDTVITDNSSGIAYDSTTGEFTITESGTYYINWWFSADGSPIATTIDLSIVTSTGEVITASNPILSGQMSGNALLDITASVGTPVTFQLINTTGNEIFVGTTTVRADLTIIKDDL